MANSNSHPRLRPLEAQWIEHMGQPAVLLQDRLALGARAVVVPQALAPLLALCDGTRDAAGLRSALELRTGLRLDLVTVERVLTQLDDALLLDNERFAAARRQALEAYRSAPFRPATLAGSSYPADPMELSALLERYLGDVRDGHEVQPVQPGRIRGLICPHIDYDRGGPVYARVWDRARAALAQTDLVILLGTDHGGDAAELTLTRQSYQTPFGVLKTDVEAVDTVARAMGEEAAFRSELNHIPEHSVELAAVWIRHLAGERDLQVVPVLCGSFQPFTQGRSHPSADKRWQAAAAALRRLAERDRTLVVAAADLAHVGPAFGDPRPVGRVELAAVAAADAKMLGAVGRGDAESFLGLLTGEQDRRRVCGLPPIFLALQILGRVTGEQVDYAQCPAPNGSSVSVAGMLLRSNE